MKLPDPVKLPDYVEPADEVEPAARDAVIYALHIGYGTVAFKPSAVQGVCAQPGNASVGVIFKSGFTLVVSASFEEMHELVFGWKPPEGLSAHLLPVPEDNPLGNVSGIGRGRPAGSKS